MTRPRWKPILGAVVVIVAGAYLAQMIASAPPVKVSVSLGRTLGFGALGLALALGHYAMWAYAWQHILRALGVEVAMRDALRTICLANLGKYAPGSIWSLLGRLYIGQHLGATIPAMVTALILENLIVAYCSALLGAAYLPLLLPQSPALGWLVFAGLVVGGIATLAWPRLILYPAHLLARLLRQPMIERVPPRRTLLTYGLLLFVAVTIFSIGGFCLAAAIMDVPLRAMPPFVAAYNASWIIGYMVPFAPAGLGVREGAFATLLTPLLTAGGAVAVSILTRVAIAIVESAIGVAALLTWPNWRDALRDVREHPPTR